MKKSLLILAISWLVSLLLLQFSQWGMAMSLLLWLSGLVIIARLWRGEKQSQFWQHLAHRDELTGLLNRRGLLTHRLSVPYCMVMLDIDRFKALNDEHGHLTGDAVLQHLAQTLQANSRQGDVCARWGGDEFVVVLSHADRQSAQAFIARLRAELAGVNDALHLPNSSNLHNSPNSCNFSDSPCVPIYTVSAGCADSSQASDSVAVLALADKALLQVKRQVQRKCQA